MSQWPPNPPQLCSMSQCDNSFDFSPLTAWPESLPAVAVNYFVLAGFSQEFVFNHQIETTDSEKISGLFRSLYFELSFAEMARVIAKARSHSWFPLEAVISKFGWQPTPEFFRIAEALRQTPSGFQKWCAEKKVGPQDLAPLLSARTLELKYLFLDILNFQLPKASGAKALELGVELLLKGHSPESLQSSLLVTVAPASISTGEAWVEALRQLHSPESFKSEQAEAQKWASLPWPGTSEAKWTRQGDRGGIELKLFVSQPSDLKKYLQSLSQVQALMEKKSPGTTH